MLMKRTSFVAILGFAAVLFAVDSRVDAGVITFNGMVGLAYPPATLSADGFTFTPENGGDSFINFQNQTDIVGNGTTNLFAANYTILTMSRPTPFSLQGFDVGGSFKSFPNRWAEGVEITGNLSGGGTVTFSFDLPATDPVLATIVLPGTFDNLTSVVFRPFAKPGADVYDYEFVLDNIVFEAAAVPEPATLAMAVTGLGLFGWSRLRRKKN